MKCQSIPSSSPENKLSRSPDFCRPLPKAQGKGRAAAASGEEGLRQAGRTGMPFLYTTTSAGLLGRILVNLPDKGNILGWGFNSSLVLIGRLSKKTGQYQSSGRLRGAVASPSTTGGFCLDQGEGRAPTGARPLSPAIRLQSSSVFDSSIQSTNCIARGDHQAGCLLYRTSML